MRDLIEEVIVDGIAHVLYKCAMPSCGMRPSAIGRLDSERARPVC